MEIRAALFVDFDNIYTGLQQQDAYTAEQFATNPERWVSWIEQEMPCSYFGSQAGLRRTLIRRCYLNPSAYRDYRPFFIRSAFEVIDCPPLTSRGKTSTDIHMVMDIVDALSHETHFDEFIILSGDADFTPVLLRIRKHDRRTAILAVGYASPAYKAACDYLIEQDLFTQIAVGVNYHEDDLNGSHESEIIPPTQELLIAMGTRLHHFAKVPGGVQANDLPAIYKDFPEFRNGEHWLGFYSLRRLTEAIVANREDLAILEGDPWRVAGVDQGFSNTRNSRAGSPAEPARNGGDRVRRSNADEKIKQEIAKYIRSILEEASTALPLATLAHAVNQYFSEYSPKTDWLGSGTFKNFLKDLDLGEVQLSHLAPGFIYDPKRHTPPESQGQYERIHFKLPVCSNRVDEFSKHYPQMAELAYRIHKLTDMPYLMPEYFALLLSEIAREINERGYHLSRTSKTVRDRCLEKGAPVARSHVNFVLIGIYSTGYLPGENRPEWPQLLGEALFTNVVNLCQKAELKLTEVEVGLIREWILGGLSIEVQAVSLETQTTN